MYYQVTATGIDDDVVYQTMHEIRFCFLKRLTNTLNVWSQNVCRFKMFNSQSLRNVKTASNNIRSVICTILRQ